MVGLEYLNEGFCRGLVPYYQKIKFQRFDIYRSLTFSLDKTLPIDKKLIGLPWGEDGKTASFEICDCSGVEFGYEDCTVSGVLNARRRWLDSGATWSVPKSKPNEWNLESSLSQIQKNSKRHDECRSRGLMPIRAKS